MTSAFGLSDFQRALFAFDRNTFVRASAGTGKTEALTGLYVHLVAGATESSDPMSPARIVAMTFTDKATEEMRDRIERALRSAAMPAGVGDAPVSVLALRETLRERGRILSEAAVARALDQLADAPIHTIHGFAARLLRSHADAANLPADLDVVDEGTASGWLEDAFVEAVEHALRSGNAALRELLEDIGPLFGMAGIVAPAIRTLASLREMGKRPEWALENSAYVDVEPRLWAARAQLDSSQVGDLRAAWDALVRTHVALVDGCPPREKKRRQQIADVADGLRGIDGFGIGGIDDLFAAVGTVEKALGDTNASRDTEPLRIRNAIRELWALPRAAARTGAIAEVMSRALDVYTRRKARERVIDFTDQLSLARNLLADHPTVRDEVVRGIGALLVDEFQDTNVIQRDLVYLLRAKSGSGRGVPAPVDLLGRGLLVVGDAKQSIYGFRNADVAVFRSVEEELAATGGRVLDLRTSRRSHRALVEGLNGLTQQTIGTGAEFPFDLAFDPRRDALEAVDEAPVPGPAVAVLEVPKDSEVEEAVLVARYLARTFGGGRAPLIRVKGQSPRAATFGDVALLLRRFTNLGNYTRALVAEGVPYVVVKGRGFFDAQEIKDGLALLDLIARTDEDRSVVAVLRSPMVLVRDGTLQALAQALGGHWWKVFEGIPSSAQIPDDDRARLHAAVAELDRARAMADRVGLGEAMRTVLAATDYLEVLAMIPNGAQRVANVEALLDELRSRERQGQDGRAVLADFRARAARDRDAESDPGQSVDAVAILTVHAAKGLQFPVVVAPDLGARLQNQSDPVLYDRLEGTGLTVAAGRQRGKRVKDAQFEKVRAVMEARDEAEHRRNFYVQITRAKDQLVLSGSKSELMKHVLAVAEATPEHFEMIDPSTLAGESVSSVPVLLPRPEVDASALLEHAFEIPTTANNLHVSVTELEDQLLCPRRYRARHLLRLPEIPRPPRVEDEAEDVVAEVDPRRRGTAVHRVLESLDFMRLVRDPRAAIEAAARAGGVTLTTDMTTRLEALAKTAYARHLAESGVELTRETPFTANLEGPEGRVLLRGQIDLLVSEGKTVHVLDYKVTDPGPALSIADYAFQLGAYALAVRRAQPEITVKAGVWFLGSVPREPIFLEPERDRGESDVPAAAASLLRSVREDRSDGRERAYCDGIGCGYRWLCHGTLAPPQPD